VRFERQSLRVLGIVETAMRPDPIHEAVEASKHRGRSSDKVSGLQSAEAKRNVVGLTE
jgi:hypothetical protein